MKVAVTGASGHIGSCLVRELKKQGAEIRILVHRYRNELDEKGVEIIEGDILDATSLRFLCERVDAVFHLAAIIAIDNRSGGNVLKTNVLGTQNLIKEVIRSGSGRFIHFSSIHAFQTGCPEEIMDETRSLVDKRKAAYEFSKAEGERVVVEAAREGLDAVILNPTAVIGPYDRRGSALGQALKKIYSSDLPFIIKGGYNWVDVRDVVSAAIKSVDAGKRGEKYILSGEYCTLRELSAMIRDISGCKIPLQVPVSVARLASPFFRIYSSLSGKNPLYTGQSLDILAHSPVCISNEKARRDLDYVPRPLEETLRDTFNWYLENNMLR